MIKMGFRKTLVGVPLATGLAIAVLAGCTPVNSAPPTTSTPTLESAIQATATPSKKAEPSIKISWEENQSKVSYTDGAVSWKTGIAEGIEEAVLGNYGILKTPSNFLVSDTFIDEKYGNVIAWGKVEGLTAFSKISLRSISSGIEQYGYWLDGKSISDLQSAYDARGNYYLLVGGSTVNNDIVFPTQDKLNRAVRSVPVIEIFKLDGMGITPVSYNPLALVEGQIINVNPVRDSKGGVNLELTVVTWDARGKRSEGVTTVPLNDVLSSNKYAPILGN